MLWWSQFKVSASNFVFEHGDSTTWKNVFVNILPNFDFIPRNA